MPAGIGATIVSITDGTTAHASDVLTSLNNLNAAGVSNDSGNIQTDGSGQMFLPIVTVSGKFNTNLTPVTVNGQTSGHADLYQYIQGNVKVTIINLVNYRITANQTLALPSAYAGRAWINVGETNGGHIACLASGAAVNIKVMTGLSGTGGTQSTQTFIQQWSQGQVDAAWDTIQFQSASQIGAVNGVIRIEGF